MYDKTFVGKVQKVAVRLSFMKSKNERTCMYRISFTLKDTVSHKNIHFIEWYCYNEVNLSLKIVYHSITISIY